MPEVMEVEIRQSCDRTGPFKAMSHVVPPMPGRIVVRSSFLILRGVIQTSGLAELSRICRANTQLSTL